MLFPSPLYNQRIHQTFGVFLSRTAICSAVGEGHFKTFDGNSYSFIGDCRYTFAEHINGSFSIEIETVLCGSSGITCTRAIEINIGATTVFLVKGSEPSVNNVAVTLPKYYNNFMIEVAGLFTIFTADMGLRVMWDGGWYLLVSLQQAKTLFKYLTKILNTFCS